MHRDFHRLAADLLARREPHAIATVVATHGSSSAKPGAKALVSRDGLNLWGWVGGGCAERHLCEQAAEAIRDGEPRLVTVDLHDEVFGVGMPCGGTMQVFIEPVFPPTRLRLRAGLADAPAFNALAVALGWEVDAAHAASADFAVDWAEGPSEQHFKLADAPGGPAERALLQLAAVVAKHRSRTGQPLRRVRQMPNADTVAPLPPTNAPELLLLGHNRITEALARLADALDWPTLVCGSAAQPADYPARTRLHRAAIAGALPAITPATAAVVATLHKDDETALRHLLRVPASYVGLIASEKRAHLLLDWLGAEAAAHPALHAPAGLDLGARGPSEIALSILAEIILCRHPGQFAKREGKRQK